MEDFQSKYSGEQVEEMLDQIANGEAGGGGGGITVETDPIFLESPAASITEAKKAEWDNKVDKVSGKQLSTEDFTSALKTKLEGLSNYDDTELSEALSTLRGDFDKLVSGDTTTAIKTFNEVIAFLDGVQDTQDLSSIIASIEHQIAGKQDKITDLDTIRSGAAKGATALQSVPSGYATTSDLDNKVDKVSGKQLSTQDFTTELEGKLKGIEANAQKNVQSDWNESDTDSDTYVNNRTHYSYEIEQVASFSIASKNQGDILVTGLLDGAFYRIYNDAGGKNEAFHFVEGRKVVIPSNGPTIEAVCAYEDDYCLKLATSTYGMTESFVLREVYVEQLNDVYIPETIARKTEIATINGQSLTEGGDITIEGGSGSVTDVTVDGTSVVNNGVATIRKATVALYGVTKLSTSVSSTSNETVPTSGTIKKVYDLANGKQDALESGTNIKTINGQSILGSGDIEIGGGGEDIRYFTEFTMNDFFNINNYDNSKLISAAINNKIICIPYGDGIDTTGYYIPNYSCNIKNNELAFTIQILTSGIEYDLVYMTINNYFEVSSIAYKTKIEYLYDTELSLVSEDNIMYIATEELSSLSVYEDLALELGSTIRFAPSEDFVLTMPENTLWANGVMPEIEPHVQYELSLTMDNNYSFLAVLTPFKSVE